MCIRDSLGESRTRFFDVFNMWDFVQEKKRQGLIMHVGFSFRSTPEELEQILSAHPEMEFVQLQINYGDWENPAVQSRACYEVTRRHEKPVIIMEPVKGGMLATPPEPVVKIFRKANPQASNASWAIRFAASLEGVITVLSGMSNLEQMEDNLSYTVSYTHLNSVLKNSKSQIESNSSTEMLSATSPRKRSAWRPVSVPHGSVGGSPEPSSFWPKAFAPEVSSSSVSPTGGNCLQRKMLSLIHLYELILFLDVRHRAERADGPDNAAVVENGPVVPHDVDAVHRMGMGFLGFPSFQHGLERILGEYIPRFSADNVRSRHGKKLFGALVEEGYLVVLIDRDDGLRLIAQDGIDVFLRIPRIFLGIGDGEGFVDGLLHGEPVDLDREDEKPHFLRYVADVAAAHDGAHPPALQFFENIRVGGVVLSLIHI